MPELLATYDYSPLTRFTASIWNRPRSGFPDVNPLYTIDPGRGSDRWAATPKTRLTLQAAEELQRYQ